VVESELGVERQQAPVTGDDQGVDLGERAVLGAVAGEEVQGEGASRRLLRPGEAEREGQAPGLEGLEAEGGVRPLSQDLLWRPRACTCAFTTTRPPSACAISRARAGLSATSPLGTVTPNSRSRALAWYS